MTRTTARVSLGELALSVLRQHAAAFAEYACHAGAADQDPEQVHQTRVATRRLRAALRLFGDVLPPAAGGLNDELKWIAGQLGPLRDLDVQGLRLAETTTSLGLAEDLAPYAAWLQAQRLAALGALREALRSPRFADLSRILAALHAWEPALGGDRPAREEGPRRLRRAYRRLRASADSVHEHAPPAVLHRTRIRAKRLRYATEFFEGVYGKRARRVVRRAGSLQDLLGDFHDGIVASQRVHEAIHTAGAGWPAETHLALGRVLQWEAQREDQSRRRFPSAYGQVKDAWKRLRRGFTE